MKSVFKLVLSILICGTVALTGFGSTVSAMSLKEGAESVQCDDYCPSDLFGDKGVFKQITNTILYIVGIIAVIMLIIGGIKYLISGGDSKKVTDAKNTVLYAIIGIVISVLAFSIVNFVNESLLPRREDKNNTTTSEQVKASEQQTQSDAQTTNLK